MWTVRDRREPGVTTMLEEGISPEHFPFSIDMPHPPFGWGALAALIPTKRSFEKEALDESKDLADKIVLAVNNHDALVESVKELQEMVLQLARSEPESEMLKHVEAFKKSRDLLMAVGGYR